MPFNGHFFFQIPSLNFDSTRTHRIKYANQNRTNFRCRPYTRRPLFDRPKKSVTFSRSPEALSRSQNGSRQSQQNQTVKLKQQPKAPNNTTSFLMSDREERQHKEEVADGQQLTAVGRPRCYSTLERFMNSGAADNVAVEEAEEEQQDADFEECLLTTAIERIEGLSREEVKMERGIGNRFKFHNLGESRVAAQR